MIVAPSVLSLDFSKFSEQVDVLNTYADYIHFDVMDGHFVNNITFGPHILKAFKKSSNLFLDVHLMVSNPKYYAERFIEEGANLITFHSESLNNNLDLIRELIDFIHSKNVKAGISIKPNTDVNIILPILKYVDYILVMSVEPGFGGQKFIESSILKISELNEYRKKNNLNFYIEVDGGIDDILAKKCKDSGADVVVAGSYIFKNNIAENIKKIKCI